MNKFCQKLMMALMVILTPALKAYAGWGSPEEPQPIMVSDSEIILVKTARCPDGKTFISWATPSKQPGWGYELRLQLIDEKGNPMWDSEGLTVENERNASWAAHYSIVSDQNGNAIISWADARDQETSDVASNSQISVLYKVNQNQELLWGTRGIELGSQYKYPAKLYQFGDDTYCVMESANDWGSPQITRLNKDGSFAFTPKDFRGQLIQSEATDFIAVYSDMGNTKAMRYTRDIQPLWANPAILSSYTSTAYGNNPYCLVSDGLGGAVVSFSREINGVSYMPIVAYVTANGDAMFGESVDVIQADSYINNYNVIGVAPESETILSTWQVSGGYCALGSQLMDFYGNRLWDDEGLMLATKKSAGGYSYIPLCVYPLADNTWLVVYADNLSWNNNQIYYGVYDSLGELISERKSIAHIGLSDDSNYFENNNLYLFFLNNSYIDNESNKKYAIMSVKLTDIEADVPQMPVINDFLFENGATSGTIKITLPDQSLRGNEIVGTMKWFAYTDGTETANGNGEAGESIIINYTELTEGFHNFSFLVEYEGNASPEASIRQYIGQDTPVPTSSVLLSVDDNTLYAEWIKVTIGVNQGWIDTDNIAYEIYLNNELVAETKDTAWIYVLPSDLPYTTYQIGIVTKCNGLKSAQQNSNIVKAGQPLSLNITIEPTAEQAELMTYIADEYGMTWEFDDSLDPPAFTSGYYSFDSLDDWLVTPPLKFDSVEANYEISFDTAAYKDYWDPDYYEVGTDEYFDVWLGDAPTVDGMKWQLFDKTKVEDGYLRNSKIFTIEQPGTYYIGFHGLSECWMPGIMLRNITVENKSTVGIGFVIDNLSIKVGKGQIEFYGIKDNPAFIYTLSGRLIAKVNYDSVINIESGVYLIKTNGITKKVFIK